MIARDRVHHTRPYEIHTINVILDLRKEYEHFDKIGLGGELNKSLINIPFHARSPAASTNAEDINPMSPHRQYKISHGHINNSMALQFWRRNATHGHFWKEIATLGSRREGDLRFGHSIMSEFGANAFQPREPDIIGESGLNVDREW